MSILIKGVEKPKDCRHCRFLNKTKISSDCKFLTVDYYCDVLEQWKGDAVCPLVELPLHGDLIDKGVLKISLLGEEYGTNFPTVFNQIIKVVNSVPIVVESEET